jgi:hypothetical protein
MGLLHRGIEAFDSKASPASARRNRAQPPTSAHSTPSKALQASPVPPARASRASSSSAYRPAPMRPSAAPPGSLPAQKTSPSTASSLLSSSGPSAVDPSVIPPPVTPPSSIPSGLQRISPRMFSSHARSAQLSHAPSANGSVRSDYDSNLSSRTETSAATTASMEGYARTNSEGSLSSTSQKGVASTLESAASQQSTPKLLPEETENVVYVCACGLEFGCNCNHRIKILCGYAESQVRKASSWKLKAQVEL